MSNNEQRESKAGVHFMQTYQTCPRQWFFKYVLGYLPEQTGMALVFGAAFHEGKATYYKTGDADAMYEVAKESLWSRQLELDKNVDIANLTEELRKMLSSALPLMASDRDDFEFLAIEREFQPELANGFKMTIRPDAVVQSKESGDVWVLEHKTTRSSITGMLRSVTNSDQATAYTMGIRKVASELGIDPTSVRGVIPEVSYLKGSVCETVAGDPICPTEWQIDAFEAGAIGILSELGDKVERLSTMPAEVLFPRSTHLCTGFLKCDYEPICKKYHDGTSVPFGFRKDSAILVPELKPLREVFK